MRKRIIQFIETIRRPGERRRVFSNLLFLTILQYASYIFPILTVPYLTRVIGVDKFGLVAFAQATVSYAGVLSSYGFPLTTTRDVAVHQDDRDRLQQIFSEVIWTKLFLSAIGVIFIGAVVALLPTHRGEYLLFIASYTVVAANVFSCEWFLQGVQDMRYITVMGLLARTITTLMVFIVIRSPQDYVILPLLSGCGLGVSAVYGLSILHRKYRVSIGVPSVSGVRRQLIQGWDVFLSTAFISLYTTSNVFLLGLLTNNTQVGYFSAAEKVVNAFRALWGPVPQVLYPYFSKAFARDSDAATRQLRKVLVIAAIATFFLSIMGCLAAPWITVYYLGAAFAPAAPIIQVLVFVVFAVGVNNILGQHGLLANHLTSVLRNIVFVSGVLNILLLVTFVRLFDALGAAMSAVTVEFGILIAEWIILRKRKLL